MSFQPLGKLIGKNIKRGGLSDQVEIAVALEKFHLIIGSIWGQEMLERVQGISIKDGILSAACLSSAAAGELKLKEKQIIEKINKDFDKKIVKGIRCKL